ncbi:Predicted arabinose efflux permease, MFS family [Sphingomonas laterariae]|uniref:Predicted arabinose efflux permease, MFS family n=1 Tax=Edaphosphingomonas laterariae TaxID=861865 RepID=A0A239BV09_9SPHN|nr:MFS transporter [Sphingomonas laterariae]SNS11003.1 Predicted arabinose efflux permease, MFS family [Sphingomonas laterariae]
MNARRFGRNYAWVVVAITFLSLLAAAGLRSAPGVMMTPLQAAFGWDRATVSAAAAFGIFLYGMVGPFAAALMQTLGIRKTLMGGLALMAASTGLSLFMAEPWHYVLTWGLLSGLGSGAVALVLGATVAGRWFDTHRGLVMGIFSASTATGSLLFLPVLAWLSEQGGWRPVAMSVAIVSALLIPLVALLLPERPADAGLLPYGAAHPRPPEPRAHPRESVALAFRVLGRAARTPVFWLLFGTFFVCGLTTNGLVGTHLIAYCGDNGMGAVQAAGLLAVMGIFDLIGTTASGWLTDRYDPRKLLFVYYGVRGLSLIALPFTGFDIVALSVFAVFYGLDWIATVPPTVKLAGQHFGDRDAPIVFGWVAAGHQIGAATAALGAGLLRDATGTYTSAFMIAGSIGVLAAFGALAIARDARAGPAEATA